MIQEFLQAGHQKINMLFLMTKPKIQFGGNLRKQKYLTTNQFHRKYGITVKKLQQNSYQEKDYLLLIVFVVQMKIPRLSVRFITGSCMAGSFCKEYVHQT